MAVVVGTPLAYDIVIVYEVGKHPGKPLYLKKNPEDIKIFGKRYRKKYFLL